MLEYLQSRLKAAEMEAAQVGGLMSEQEAANEAEDQHRRDLHAANAQLEVRSHTTAVTFRAN